MSSQRQKSKEKINDIDDRCKELEQKKGSMLRVRLNKGFFIGEREKKCSFDQDKKIL